MNLPSFLTEEQKLDIQQSLRDTQLRKEGEYFKAQDRLHYAPIKVAEPEPAKSEFKQLKWKIESLRAGQNMLENKVNTYQDDIKGLMKLSHSHSKKLPKGEY